MTTDGWAVSTIGEETLTIEKHRPADEPDKEFDYIDISSIDNRTNSITETKRLIGRDAPSRARQRVQSGDTVLSTVRTYLQNTAQVPKQLDGATASTGFSVLRAGPRLDPKFLFYRTLEQGFINEISSKQTGSSYPAVRDGDVRAMKIVFPPIDEQRRIVEAIETHLSHLDAGVESLEQATTQVERMRTAVLKAASSGELVPQDADEEPASELLRRVLDERRSVWEEKGPTKRYKKPVQPDVSGPLPEGWTWASVSQLSYAIEYGTSTKASRDPAAGVPVLRMGNIINGVLDFSDLKYIPHSDPDIDRYLLDEGDVLFNRTNSAELVGKTAVFQGFDTPVAFASYLIRVKPLGVLPNYLAAYINGPQGRRYIASVRSQQVGQANVNGTKLGAMPVALPPVSEQRRIVEEVERQMSVLAALDTSLDRTRRRSDGLRRAVLAKAFSGELINQMAFA